MNTSIDKKNRSAYKGEATRLLLLIVALVIDQYTKFIARQNFGLPNGEPDYFKVHQVIGEWLQFRLVYNSGAAFGMKPQELVPFLNPTVFYALFSTVAIGVLVYYYIKLQPQDYWQKSGVALILSGAFGNLIDRLKFQKVTDFIDVGIPSMSLRWPTFNIADSCVCIGVTLILVAPMFIKKLPQNNPPTPSDAPASGDNGASSAGS
jgi:signal peptidase II